MADLDRLALNLACDLDLADQDLWLRELLQESDTLTEFADAVRSHIDLLEDGLARVYNTYLTWGVEPAIREFDDEIDRAILTLTFSPEALAIQEREYYADITIPNRRYARSAR